MTEGAAMDLLSAAVGLTSLGLGVLAVWLSVTFYLKAKDAETADSFRARQG